MSSSWPKCDSGVGGLRSVGWPSEQRLRPFEAEDLARGRACLEQAVRVKSAAFVRRILRLESFACP